MTAITDKVIREVYGERLKQDLRWGVQDHDPTYWLGILGEEFGEVCKEIIEYDYEKAREELVQVAAVAVGMIEYLDRKDAT